MTYNILNALLTNADIEQYKISDVICDVKYSVMISSRALADLYTT